MAQSSINIKPIKGNSNSHNLRTGKKLDYVHSDLTPNNEYWTAAEYQSPTQYKKIQADLCLALSGRKLQRNATPLREAVVNLNSTHSLADVQKLASALEQQFKIKPLQIAIHKDEGKSPDELNYHAHIVFDWQNKQTGKMLRLNKFKMTQMQTLAAESLGMERGKEGSKAIRLESQAYKASQEVKKLTKDVEQLAQKKSLQQSQKLADEYNPLGFAPSKKKQWQALKQKSKTLSETLNHERATTPKLEQTLSELEQHPRRTNWLTLDGKFQTLSETLQQLNKTLSKQLERSKSLKQKLTSYLKPNSASLQLARKHHNTPGPSMGM